MSNELRFLSELNSRKRRANIEDFSNHTEGALQLVTVAAATL